MSSGTLSHRARAIVLALIATSVCVAAPAAYADFYVDGATGSGTACTPAASPCATIQAGVAAAEAAGGAQTVHVAAGQYSGEVDVTSGDISIIGAGPTMTTSQANNADSYGLAVTSASAEATDIGFSIPALQHGVAAVVRGPSAPAHLTLNHVDLQNSGNGMHDDGLFVGLDSTATVGSQSTVTNDGVGSAALDVEGNLSFADSTATSTSTTGLGGFVVSSNLPATIDVRRSYLYQQNPSGTTVSLQTAGGSSAVTASFFDDDFQGGSPVFLTTEGTADNTLNIYNNTISAGATSAAIVSDLTSTGTNHLKLSLDSNILFGTLPAGAHETPVLCSYNNLPPGVTPGISCDHTTNFGVNSLYPAGLDNSANLSAGSTAIDAGDPAALGAAEPTTDLHGQPRVQSSTGACTGGIRDLGATEYQGGAGQPLTVTVDGPGAGTTGSPLTFTATNVAGASYAWEFGDGATATTAVSASHTYTTPGVHTVKVTVSGTGGCSGVATKAVTVTPAPAPSATITSPANGAIYSQGQVVAASYSCRDAAGGPGIATCAGPVANGAAIDTSALGVHTFKVTATSKSGASSSATSAYTVVAGGGPVVSNAAESNARWRLGSKPAIISAKRKAPVGTTFSFSLSEAARVTFAFSQSHPGRKVHGTCVKPTKRNRHKPPCRIAAVSGTLAFNAHAGANRVFFDGPLGGGKRLRRGAYTLTITAVDASGKHSTPVSLRFKIVK